MSSPIPILYKGESKLIVLPLLLEDGTTALLVSSLTYAAVELYQAGTTPVATYVKDTDGELRAGDETDELILELTPALTESLTARKPLTARLKLKVSDEDFEESSDAFTDVSAFTIASNVL